MGGYNFGSFYSNHIQDNVREVASKTRTSVLNDVKVIRIKRIEAQLCIGYKQTIRMCRCKLNGLKYKLWLL